MIRVFFYVLGLAGITAFFAWLAEQPGTLHVSWRGYDIDTDVFNLFLSLFVLIAGLFLTWNLFRKLVETPAVLNRIFKQRRQKRGLEALTGGIIAISAGDRDHARRYAIEARKSLPNEPLTALLRAQTAQLMGDRDTARRIYEAMLESPDTELLGLRGLYLEAFQENETEAARQFAERAMKINPKLDWCVSALFGFQCRSGDWLGALKTLETARRHGHLDKALANRRRAVLLTAQAIEAQETDLEKAIELASEAHRLESGLVPAAEIAGRLLASKGQTSRAARIISRTWKRSPHPDLALVYAYARPGDSPRDRLKRVHALAQLTPHNVESSIAIATAAIEARQWDEARDAISHLIRNRPTARVCTLMAQIEGGEYGDKGRVREWLARAVRAQRDAAWTADGYVSDTWLPISPITGELDAFEWKVPVEALSTVEADTSLDDIVPVGAAASVLIPASEAKIGAHLDDAAPEEAAIKDMTAKAGGAAGHADNEPAARKEITAASWTGASRDLADGADQPGKAVQAPADPLPSEVEAGESREDAPKVLEKRRAPPAKDASQSVASAKIMEAPPDGAKEPTLRPEAEMPTPPQQSAADDKVKAGKERRAAAKPKIFVPPRAPDDPGPEAMDPDEAPPTPLARYRMPASKAK
jgi:HemY protein